MVAPLTVWTLADCAARTLLRSKGAARLLIWMDLPSVLVNCRAVTSVIFPFATVIWTWTGPNRVPRGMPSTVGVQRRHAGQARVESEKEVQALLGPDLADDHPRRPHPQGLLDELADDLAGPLQSALPGLHGDPVGVPEVQHKSTCTTDLLPVAFATGPQRRTHAT